MYKSQLKMLFTISLLSIISACVTLKQAGKDIGHTTKKVTTDIGHASRDIAKEATKVVKEN